jgi:hypothetical protein
MIKRTEILAITVALSSSAQGEELDDVNKLAMNNFSYELIECAAFYGFTEICLDNQNPALKQNLKSARDVLAETAYVSAATAGLKVPDVPMARMKMAMSDFQQETDHDCRNISILLEKHLSRCAALLKSNPEQALKSHIEKAKRTIAGSKPAQ